MIDKVSIPYTVGNIIESLLPGRAHDKLFFIFPLSGKEPIVAQSIVLQFGKCQVHGKEQC